MNDPVLAVWKISVKNEFTASQLIELSVRNRLPEKENTPRMAKIQGFEA